MFAAGLALQPLSGSFVSEPHMYVQSFRNSTFVDGLIPLVFIVFFQMAS